MAGPLRLQIRDASGVRDLQFDTSPVLIGRDETASIRLNDPLVSRLHGRFDRAPDGWYYADNGSRNGSGINGQRLQPQQPVRLGQGMVVQAGGAVLNVLAVDAPSVQPPPRPTTPPPAAQGTIAVPPEALPHAAGPLPTPPPVAAGPRPAGSLAVQLGRALDNEIRADDPYVSSYHAEAWLQGPNVVIKDLNSRNGTFIGDQRVTEAVAPPTGVIRLGPNFAVPVAQILQRLHQGAPPSMFLQMGAQLDHLLAGQGLGRIVGKERKYILRNVDISVRRGEFLAIVGGSGAGKSTLLKVLNRYTPPEEGVLFLAKNPQGVEEIGYVPQDDIIHRELVLKDALVLSAMLRYPPGTPREVVERRADEVLTELGLSERKDVLVSALSGGQRKRASVALELMTKPRLLLLDEPTSGLDPASGSRLMRLLRALADTGIGVVLITHATADVDGCDTVAFLAPGGYLVSYGSPEQTKRYFGTNDWVQIYEQFEPEQLRRKPSEAWRREFEGTPAYADLRRSVDSGMRELAPQQAMPVIQTHPDGEVTKWQIAGLARRYFRTILGDRRNLALLFGQVPIILLLAFLIFKHGSLVSFDANSDGFIRELVPKFGSVQAALREAHGSKNGTSLLFILSASLVWLGTINSAREICKELPIWEREQHIGVKPIPYVLSKVLVLGALCAIQTLVLVAMMFVLWKVPGGGGALAGIMLVGFLTALSGEAVGLCISAAVPTSDRAVTIVPVAMIPQIMFSGGLIALSELGSAKWLSAIFGARWAFQAFGRLTKRDFYIGNPANPNPANGIRIPNSFWEQFQGSWVTGALGLVVLTVVFTGLAMWLVIRKSSVKTATTRVTAPPAGQYVGGQGVAR